MIKKIKRKIWSILIKLKIGGIIQIFLSSGIRDDGWFESFNTKKSIDKYGTPIPWCTYSFIKFIEPRLKRDFLVFEYGSGNSTFWYAKRVGFVKCVEHDLKWYNENINQYSANVQAVYRPFNNDLTYASEISKDNIKYHIIIIDGVDRNNCAKFSIQKLTENGVIVYDNTQLPDYRISMEFLLENGYKRIDFEGLLPIVSYNNITSIFYKDNNCLGI